jgi:Polyketide cyclase / dehydrase and lipid transport
LRRIRHSAVIDAAVDEVWSAIAAFGHWGAWMPTIVDEEIEAGMSEDRIGCVRKLTTETGAVARERLLALDPPRRSITYNLEESPNYPVDDYVATMRVRSVTEGDRARCLVEWSGEFSAADPAVEDEIAAGLTERIYRGGLAALATHFEPSNDDSGGVR